MDQLNVDQNQFMKQVRERAQVKITFAIYSLCSNTHVHKSQVHKIYAAKNTCIVLIDWDVNYNEHPSQSRQYMY